MLLLIFLVLLFSNQGFAQRVTGTVIGANNQPVSGATVQVKGSNTATATDASGRFTIDAPGNATLVISSIGFATQEIPIGGRTSLSISMTGAEQGMNEVVVTALGIRRQQRSLGYSASVVKPEELTVNRTPNLMNALQGKIAGVNITAPSTGPGGSSKIRIRGQSSIGGANGPLIVINGVPVDNSNFGANLNIAGSDNVVGPRGGGVSSDAGDGFQSINPDDVESMTVLKGAPAAALYGYRAANGVIMITTKSRGAGQGIGVTYNMNYSNETPLDYTDYQYEYGQGENGKRPTTPNPTSGQWSFGEKFQPGMRQVLFNGLDLPYEPQRHIIRKFFRNGENMSHTVTMAANSDKGGLNLSLGNMQSKGIVPNNRFTRRTLNLGFTYDLSERFTFSGNVNYSNEYNKNPPNVGNQDNTIPVVLYNMANSMPLDVLDANKYNAEGNEYIYSRFMNRTNPYWVLAEQFNNIRRDRIFGNITMKYNILSWLYIQGRIGQDYWSRSQDYNNFPTGHASRGPAPTGFVNGQYTQEARRFRELNTDFLLSATREFGDFGLNVTAGGNQQRNRSEVNSVQVTDFVVRGLYTVQNGRAKDPTYSLGEEQVNSLYGSAELSYRRTIYLNGTARNDWFSVLSPANRSILYPSVSASYIFSENFSTPWLSFGKVRAGYAEVGSSNALGAGSNVLYYQINSNLLNGQPVGGISGNTVPNPALRPMRIAETEVGLEMRMFQNRLGIDLSAYRKITTDQIVTAQISDASGFVDTRINSGKSLSKGIELLLNITPVERKFFTWDFTYNGSYNITKVLKLLTETPGERITVGTHVFNGELRQVVGLEMAQIAGFGFKRDANGNKIFGANGLPLRTPDLVLFGSALPNWVGGFTNTFRYRGINLSFLIDYKLGGKMLSGTNFNAIRHGLHKMTLEGRANDYKIVGEGVNESGGKNTAVAPVQSYWEVVRSQALVEPVIYDDGYWKLRQITLGYDFSKYLPGTWPVKGVRLNLTANNVLLIKKWVDNIDPESFGFSSDNVLGMETTGLPTTRSIGFNLNVRF
ncbi:MAG: SusC/RagA family TonB-linked outer membrane protein [Flavisolibacter sp.]|nr:SusC/RagA family TonB-linked outer membrane protein [Flavisolibacter sp.]MBD0349868.1 SusC/RagA family TonB-linked outer membrane protein [Flavisolibacter sp.]MBD0375179.1 SusC/RagA family TonB-linked outer membrane protein [Flavisolibacter sp.]